MIGIKRLTASLIIAAFICNIFFIDTGFSQNIDLTNNSATLAAASKIDDILGFEFRTMREIAMLFKGCLEYLKGRSLPITLKNIKDPNILPENVVNSVAEIQVMRRLANADSEGVITIKVKVERKSAPPQIYWIRYSPDGKAEVYPDGKAPAAKKIVKPRSKPRSSVIGQVKWITPTQATPILDAFPNISSIEKLQKLSAEALASGLSDIEFLEKFRPELMRMAKILSKTRPVDELNELVRQNALIFEGEAADDSTIYDKQIKRLDILRGVSELILQLLPEEQSILNTKRLERIRRIFVKHKDITKLLVQYFEARFNPDKDLDERGEAAGKIRIEILKMIRKMNNYELEDYLVVEKALGIMIATLKTDYYIEDRTSLFFRIDPRAIVKYDEAGALVHTPPFAVIWVHVPYHCYGSHARYENVARGGLRLMNSKDDNLLYEVLPTCVDLAKTQHDKHSDIPEAGAKGAYIYKEGLNVVAATIGYADGLINCMMENDKIVVSSGATATDPLELGPDVGTGELADIITARAWMKGLPDWRLLMTGKSQILGGVSHKSSGLDGDAGDRVTSQGVMEHGVELVRYLRDIGKIKSGEGTPIVFTVTGGLDGDVGSGLIKGAIAYYGSMANMRGIVDASGVMFDPEGLDHKSLLAMYYIGDTADKFPLDKLHKGGFVARAKPGSGEDSYITLDSDSLKCMNTRALDPEIIKNLGIEGQYKPRAGLKENDPLITVLERDSKGYPSKVKVHTVYLRDAMFFIIKSDMLFTGSSGRNNINQYNWPLFFDWEDNPVSVGITHGANVFIHKTATIKLENKGVVIEPDEKANSVGVEISSRVEIDYNLIFRAKEMTLKLLRSYFKQVLKKCLESAKKKFWALRVEAATRPGESVVTKVSKRMSKEIIRLSIFRIARSAK